MSFSDTKDAPPLNKESRSEESYDAPLLGRRGGQAVVSSGGGTFDADATTTPNTGVKSRSGSDYNNRDSTFSPRAGSLHDASTADMLDDADDPTPEQLETLAVFQEQAKRSIVVQAVRRSALVLALLPFVGTVYIGVALRERHRRRILSNPSDWMVLLWIGVCAQLSIFAPLLNAVSSDASRVLSEELHTTADYLGPFIVFPATSLYLAATAIAFLAFTAKQRIQVYERPKDFLALSPPTLSCRSSRLFPSGRSSLAIPPDAPAHASKASRVTRRRHRELLENIQLIKYQIQEDTVLPTWIVIFMSLAVGFVEMLSLRVCAWSGWTDFGPPGATCGSHVLTFQVPGFNTLYYHVATSFWLVTFSALSGLIFLALATYYQQLRQIERFTYISKGGHSQASASGAGGGGAAPSSPTSGMGAHTQTPDAAAVRLAKKLDRTKDLFSPKNLSIWISVWKELLRDLRSRPVMQAVSLTSVISCIVSGVVTVTYVIFDNLFQGSAVAEFTSGCISVFIVCCMALGGFLYITVRLQYVVDFQIASISQTQTYVQRQLEVEISRHHERVDAGSGAARGNRFEGENRGTTLDEDARHKMLKAKVNVLQALDTVLRTSESKPKLLGLSLETIRWSVIIIGLIVMNVAFFVLYRTRCSGDKDPVSTRHK